jgi:hypothetical protein
MCYIIFKPKEIVPLALILENTVSPAIEAMNTVQIRGKDGNTTSPSF